MRRLPVTACNEDKKKKTAQSVALLYVKATKGIWRHKKLLHAGGLSNKTQNLNFLNITKVELRDNRIKNYMSTLVMCIYEIIDILNNSLRISIYIYIIPYNFFVLHFI